MHYLLFAAHVLLALSDWITSHKELLTLIVVASGGVSLSLEPVKRWLGLQNAAVINLYHYGIALLPTGVHYIQGSHSQSPIIIFAQALIIVATNQFIYPLFTKPLAGIFVDAKAKVIVKKTEQTTNTTFAG